MALNVHTEETMQRICHSYNNDEESKIVIKDDEFEIKQDIFDLDNEDYFEAIDEPLYANYEKTEAELSNLSSDRTADNWDEQVDLTNTTNSLEFILIEDESDEENEIIEESNKPENASRNQDMLIVDLTENSDTESPKTSSLKNECLLDKTLVQTNMNHQEKDHFQFDRNSLATSDLNERKSFETCRLSDTDQMEIRNLNVEIDIKDETVGDASYTNEQNEGDCYKRNEKQSGNGGKQIEEMYANRLVVWIDDTSGYMTETRYKPKFQTDLIKRIVRDETTMRYKCPVCSHTIKSKQNMIRHVTVKHDTHSQLYSCPECQYTSKTRQNWLRHLKVWHGGSAESHRCSICATDKRNEEDLLQHVKDRHDADGAVFKCSQCAYRTKSKCRFDRHTGRMHSVGNRMLKCENCEFRYKKLGQLKRHIEAVHKKPLEMFKCSKCPFVNASSFAVREHVKKKHQSNAKKVHRCPYCRYAVSRNNRFLRHMKRRHAEKFGMHKCPHCSYENLYKHHVARHMKRCHVETIDLTSS